MSKPTFLKTLANMSAAEIAKLHKESHTFKVPVIRMKHNKTGNIIIANDTAEDRLNFARHGYETYDGNPTDSAVGEKIEINNEPEQEPEVNRPGSKSKGRK